MAAASSSRPLIRSAQASVPCSRRPVVCKAAAKEEGRLRRIAVSLVASVVLSGSVLDPVGIAARASITQKQNAEAEQLAEIIRRRTGQPLPKAASLLSETSGAMDPALLETSATRGGDASAAFRLQLDALQKQLERQGSELAEARQERTIVQAALEKEQEELRKERELRSTALTQLEESQVTMKRVEKERVLLQAEVGKMGDERQLEQAELKKVQAELVKVQEGRQLDQAKLVTLQAEVKRMQDERQPEPVELKKMLEGPERGQAGPVEVQEGQ